MRADELIAEGHFRKLLPPRLKSPRKSKGSQVQIQMAQIAEADSEYEVGEKHQAPSRKAEVRSQLLEELKTHFPINHFLVAFLCFLIYESLCISLPPLITYFGMQSDLWNIVVSYSVLLFLALGG